MPFSIPPAEWNIFSVTDVTFYRNLRLISGNGPKPWTRQDMTREESMIFYETHARRLYNTAMRIVSDSPLAEEIMQDTVLKYIMSDPGLSGAQASVWLTRTCVRKSIDALRRKKRERLFLEEYPRQDEAEEGGSDTECSGGYAPEMLARALAELPRAERIVLSLILIEGLDYSEVSEYLGVSEATLRVRFMRAKRRLAGILKGETKNR